MLLVVVLLVEMLLESPPQGASLTGLAWGDPAGEVLTGKGECMEPLIPFAKFGVLFRLAGFGRGWAPLFGPGVKLGLLDVDLDGDETICL
jgi:hypothetical protein